jgi:hypothetical protein
VFHQRRFSGRDGKPYIGLRLAKLRTEQFAEFIEAADVANLFCFGDQLIDGDDVIVDTLCLLAGSRPRLLRDLRTSYNQRQILLYSLRDRLCLLNYWLGFPFS